MSRLPNLNLLKLGKTDNRSESHLPVRRAVCVSAKLALFGLIIKMYHFAAVWLVCNV